MRASAGSTCPCWSLEAGRRMHTAALEPDRRPPLMRALGLAAGLFAGCAGSDAAPLSAVLVTLDTTNRDALGCYGQELPLTPALDRLAAESLVFEEARTVAPLTLPAHASMLTGLVPLRHGVRDNGLVPLPAPARTLAEGLREVGFQTAAFVSAVVLAAPYGLDQGFDVYDAPRGSAGGPTAHMLERATAETVRAACDWLRGRDRGRPFFLWVHGFEPHEPHAPPPDCLALAGGDPYLGEVAALDRALGELFTVLEEEHGLDRTALVVSADHGEALGDHGERTHSVLCYERVLRVPLLVRLPGRARAGERTRVPASVADIGPTLLAALGLPAEPELDGRDLAPAQDAASASTRGTYFESCTGYLNYGWAPIAGWVEGGAKYLHGTEPELYDLVRDPLERTNLIAERAAEAERARDAIAALASRTRLAAVPAAAPEELRADIEALGYAGGAAASAVFPEPLAPTGLPDARGRMGELERFYRAVLQHNAGKVEPAIAELRALVEENPENVYALNVLATYLHETRKIEEALATLQRIPERGQDRVNVQDLLGHCLEQLGETARARAHFERALALKPGDPHQLQDLARVRGAPGGSDEAPGDR